MDPICCIIGAGPSSAYVTEGAFVIAADGGLDKLNALHITPDLILGDFDSLGDRPMGENVLTFPVEKDDTDTMLAIKEAVKRGYKTLYISGGVGGRLDHTIANIQSLWFADRLGVRAFLVGQGQTLTVLTDGEACFSADCRGKISLFSMGDRADGVTVKGLKYETEGITLSGSFPLGVSNEFTERAAQVKVEKGTLLLIWEGLPCDWMT
ncbi:MAG: thiamine diphosphokinase [Ruminococcaceae bacterium]|nr:thiamine diphosphokinase [Oscillospiraceae bacterium]